MIYHFRKGLHDKTVTLATHKINEFLVFKTIHEHEQKLYVVDKQRMHFFLCNLLIIIVNFPSFDEQKLQRNAENLWIATMNALEYLEK